MNIPSINLADSIGKCSNIKTEIQERSVATVVCATISATALIIIGGVAIAALQRPSIALNFSFSLIK